MKKSVKEHVYRAIESTPLQEHPFPQLEVRDVFPEDYYAELLARLPDDSEYKKYSAPYEERHFIQLTETSARQLSSRASPFWTEFEAWLHSQEFLDRMAQKFARLLPINREYRQRQLDKNADATGAVRIASRSLLVRDYANFALGPHTDSGKKFIVGAFYFPRDESLREFGTSIYEPKQDGRREWDCLHLPHEEFNLVRTVKNVPNSLFVFMKTDNSWHGVENRPHANVGRDVLFWIPQLGQAEGVERYLSLPRCTFEEAPARSLLSRLFR